MPFNPTDEPNDIFETGQVEPYLGNTTAIDSTAIALDPADGNGDISALVWLATRAALLDVGRGLLVTGVAESVALTDGSTLSQSNRNTVWAGGGLAVVVLENIDLEAGEAVVSKATVDTTGGTISAVTSTLTKTFTPPVDPNALTIRGAKYYG